jgi:type I restriction enzyme R subunit
MNEAETRAELIDPALKAAGWGVVEGSRVRREVITLGRLQGGGQRARQEIADYVLAYRGQKLGVIEAKRRGLPETEGVGQAKAYAAKLDVRFAFSTNGDRLYRIDMATGAEGPVAAYPSPESPPRVPTGPGESPRGRCRRRRSPQSCGSPWESCVLSISDRGQPGCRPRPLLAVRPVRWHEPRRRPRARRSP